MADAALEGATAYNTRSAGLQTALDNIRHNRAMNALETIYGPTASEPAAAQANENYLASIQQDPLKTQSIALGNTAQDLANQGTAITNRGAAATQGSSAAYRAAQLLKAQAGPDGSIPPDAYDRIITPNADMLGIDPAHVGPLKTLLSQPGGAAHLDTISQALLGPAKVQGNVSYGTDSNGNPVAIETLQNGQIVQRPLNGTTPTIVRNAGTAAFRANTGRQQAGTAAFNAGVRANNSEFGSPDGSAAPGTAPVAAAAPAPNVAPTKPTGGLALTPAGIQKFIQNNGGIDGAIAATANLPRAAGDAAARAIADYVSKNPGAAKPVAAPAAAAAPAIPPDSLYARLPPKGRQEAISGAQSIANQATNLQTINQLLDTVDSTIGPYTSGAGSTLNKLPGTAATDLKANLESLKAAGLTAWINSLKNAKGQTGIGRVLQSEANAATALFGNMEQDQSTHQLAFHAQLFRRAVNNLFTHAQQAYHAQYGVKPEDVLGGGPITTTAPKPQPAAALSDADLFKKYGIK